jgi:hypothetical protein
MSQLSKIERTLARGRAWAVCPAATHAVIADAGHDVVLERGVAVLGVPDAPPRESLAGASGIRRA